MCMNLFKNQADEDAAMAILKKNTNKNGIVTVWKRLDYDYSTKTYRSEVYPCTAKPWVKGVWKNSNRKEQRLSFEERTNKEIHYGIHVFLEKKDAQYYGTAKKVQCEMKDLVAVGTLGNNNTILNAVFMKAKLV